MVDRSGKARTAEGLWARQRSRTFHWVDGEKVREHTDVDLEALVISGICTT